MATPLRMKRMARERVNLEKPNDDYFVHFENDNLFSFFAYVMGPADTLYAHKFVKLKIDIPQRYPLVPPEVKFIQHTGGRLHPNLYVEGKVCLSILGTWQGEKWAFAMTIETVLITIRSLLDNSPYKHEPHQSDNPNFNDYVQYATWKSLLLDHVSNESNAIAKAFLQKHVNKYGTKMIYELQRLARANPGTKQLRSPYGDTAHINYEQTLQDVIKLVDECRTSEAARQATLAPLPLLQSGDSLSPISLDDTQLSSTEAAKSQRKPAQTNTPPPQSDNQGTPSLLKRKHELIDLT